MVANPTVTVSRSTSVETDVTVIKILVVIPSMLVDVLVPPSAPMKPMSALLVASAFLPLPSVGAGAACDVDAVVVVGWWVTGITTSGSSSVIEEAAAAGVGAMAAGKVEAVEAVVRVVWPGWCSAAAATAVVLVEGSVWICSGSDDLVLVGWVVELSAAGVTVL